MVNKIYIFGNPLLDFDSLPIKLQPELQTAFPDMHFEYVDPNENLHPENGMLVIIDTVINIEQPMIIDDIEKFDLSPRFSMHDLDLAFNLKLLKKIGILDKAIIIALPPDYDKDKALISVISFINKIKASH